MVVIKKKSNQRLLVDHQEETTTHPFQKSCEELPPPPVEVPPRKQQFERVLAHLTVDFDYPGYAVDVSVTREAMMASSSDSTTSKSKVLRLFRMMKEKQRVYEYYNRNQNNNNNVSKNEIDALEFKRSGIGDTVEKRDTISEDWRNDNTKEEEDVRDNIEDDPRDDKEDIYFEDRSHPNLVALLESLVLTYPCIQDTAHSLQVKQDRHIGDRSHWRLQKLDDLESSLTYPEWEKDLEQVEDWHRHHSDTRENTIIFHEVMEGILNQQHIYLSWEDHQEQQRPPNPFPDVDQLEAPSVHSNCGSSDDDNNKGVVVDEMMKPSVDIKSEQKKTDPSMVDDGKKNKMSEHRSSSSYMTVGALCAARRRRSSSLSKSSSTIAERREASETEKKNRYYRKFTSSSLSSSSSLPRRRPPAAADTNSPLSQQTTGPPPPPPSTVTATELGHCAMCTSRANTHVLVPCGHLGCADCSHHAWRTRARCPTCQQTVDKVVRLEAS